MEKFISDTKDIVVSTRAEKAVVEQMDRICHLRRLRRGEYLYEALRRSLDKDTK